MSESHFDQYEHYNFDQDKAMYSGHSGKQRSKKEAALNTNHHNPGGHERKIVTKLMNAEKNAAKETKNAGTPGIKSWANSPRAAVVAAPPQSVQIKLTHVSLQLNWILDSPLL